MKRMCKQEKCAFNKGISGCPTCSECKSSSNLVDTNCTKCYNCENDEGLLRGEDDIDKVYIVADEIEVKR